MLGAFRPGIVDAGTDIVDRPALVASSCGYDFTRIPIQQNVHDAIIHYLLKNEGYEEELETDRAVYPARH